MAEDADTAELDSTMYLLMTDESNLQPSKRAEFFIYGGVFFPLAKLIDLHNGVTTIRDKYGYKTEDVFKFDVHSKPKQVSREDFTAAKNGVLELASNHGLRFVAYVVLHDIARNASVQKLVSAGANTVIGRFQYFLHETNNYGVCVVDRLPFQGGLAYLRRKFQKGLLLDEGRLVPMPRVLLYGETTIGGSHVASVIDIVLGAFRYCVNERQKDEVPQILLPKVVQLMWHERVGDKIYLRGRGLILRPKEVKVPAYKERYEELIEHLKHTMEVASEQTSG